MYAIGTGACGHTQANTCLDKQVVFQFIVLITIAYLCFCLAVVNIYIAGSLLLLLACHHCLLPSLKRY